MEKNSRKRCEFLSPISLKILILHVLFPNTVEITFLILQIFSIIRLEAESSSFSAIVKYNKC